MARTCPDKRKRPSQGEPKKKFEPKPKIAQLEVVYDREEQEEEKEPDPPPYDDPKTLLQKIRTLKIADREAFLTELAEEDFV